MRHIEFVLEEPSCEDALRVLVPRLVGERATYQYHAHNGYPALKKYLPSRLRAYRRRITSGEDLKVVVLIDEDRAPEGCQGRKEVLETIAQEAGLTSKTANAGSFDIVNRIAVEELEAWYFGQPEALRQAYPGLSERVFRKRVFSDPDSVPNGTNESLLKELKNAGYYPGIEFLPKTEVARRVAPFMRWDQSRSKSFRVFREGVNATIV